MADVTIKGTGPGSGKSTLGDKVYEPLQAYSDHQNTLELGRALMGGTDAMRAKGTQYLPQEEGESDPKYTARLNRTVLLNVFGRTIQKLAGEVFSKDVELDPDVPDELKGLEDNIDLTGRTLSKFSRELLEDGMTDGVVHFLVDYPTGTGRTVAEQREAGARPYFIHVPATNLIGWRHEIRKGKPVLTQVRIKEDTEVPDGEFGMTMVERIRVIEPNRFRVFEKMTSGAWEIALDENGNPLEGATTMDEVPLITIMLGEAIDKMTARPPLEDLAWLNLLHWQSSSDQRNILHYARMIVYFGKMLDVDESGKITFGPNRLIHSRDPQGDLKVVEHSGAAIASGKQDLDDLKEEMALFGLTLMVPKTGNQTATEKAIDSAENDSTLQGWAKLLQQGLNKGFELMAKYLNIEWKGSVKVNTDYKTALRGYEATVIITAFEKNLISREVAIEELRRRGLITQDIDLEDLVAQLDKERAQSPTLAGLAGTPTMPGQELPLGAGAV